MPLLFLLTLLSACSNPEMSLSKAKQVAELTCPPNATRLAVDSNSFAHYLRSFPLKASDSVYLFDGRPKYRQDVQVAVLDIDMGKRDLQQCADAVMRLRAEYLWNQKAYAKISFHFVNGQNCEYSQYAKGFRPVFKGNRFSWVKKQAESYAYKTFRNYMDLVFSYAGTASLIKELKKVSLIEVQIGDVLIQSGQPYGHAVIVMDVCVTKAGKRYFLLAQSYMPAQDMHILKNPAGGMWYSAEASVIRTPEWTFSADDLHRFP